MKNGLKEVVENGRDVVEVNNATVESPCATPLSASILGSALSDCCKKWGLSSSEQYLSSFLFYFIFYFCVLNYEKNI